MCRAGAISRSCKHLHGMHVVITGWQSACTCDVSRKTLFLNFPRRISISRAEPRATVALAVWLRQNIAFASWQLHRWSCANRVLVGIKVRNRLERCREQPSADPSGGGDVRDAAPPGKISQETFVKLWNKSRSFFRCGEHKMLIGKQVHTRAKTLP